MNLDEDRLESGEGEAAVSQTSEKAIVDPRRCADDGEWEVIPTFQVSKYKQSPKRLAFPGKSRRNA